jgi:hypothetical protein
LCGNWAGPLAKCGLSPSSVTLGSSPSNTTLTITAPSSLNAFVVPLNEAYGITSLAVFLLIPSLAGIGLGGSREFRIGPRILSGGLIAIFFVFCGCGGSSTPPPPKSYTVIVTATAASGSQQHSATVALTVQ